MNADTPKVSVVVPLYNKEQWVARSISSVLRQSYGHFELIVVDDGSTDASASVVRSFRDDRIQLIAKKNGGEGSARNEGIKCARGQYIAFVDADDEWRDGHLLVLLNALSTCPDAILACDEYRGSPYSHLDVVKTSAAETMTAASETVCCYQFDYLENLAIGSFVTSCSSTMVRASVLQQNRLQFNEKLGRGVDVNFWINLSRYGPFLYCDFAGARYHRDDPMSEMIRPRSTAKAMPNYFLDIPGSAFTPGQLRNIDRFLKVEYLKAAYLNRGLPFVRAEMACAELQRRRLFTDVLYFGVRFLPYAILRLAKKVKGKARASLSVQT
jgi:glycosyltransferase involved in cell wall biosynthesis